MTLPRSLGAWLAFAACPYACGSDPPESMQAAGKGSGGTTNTSGTVAGSSAGAVGAVVPAEGGQASEPRTDASADAAASDGPPATTAVDDEKAAKVLDGYLLSKPCVDTFVPTASAAGHGACCCNEKPDNENQHRIEHFGGEAGVTYDVTLRVRGIFERYWYEGGTLDQGNQLFYRGGVPTIHSALAPNKGLIPGQGACKLHPPETDRSFALPFAVPPEIAPVDGCFNGFNVFALVVASPKKSYYFNYTTDYDNHDRQPHWVYKNDYTVIVPVDGLAQLDFYTIDGDHHQVTNDGTMSVADPVNVAQPYNGNFLQLDVVAVKRVPR